MITLYYNQEYEFEWITVDSDRILTDPTEIKYRVISGAGVQIDSAVGWDTLDLVAQKVRTGVYSIPWTVTDGLDVGQYYLEVSDTVVNERISLKEFEIIEARVMELTSDSQGRHLAPLWALRGLYSTKSDKELYKAVSMASRSIEAWCSYSFTMRYSSQDIVCRYTGKLDLPMPVGVIESVEDSSDVELAIDCLFARHLINPSVGIESDDRLTSYLNLAVYNGAKYNLTGWCGYTDYGYNILGRTPEMISASCIRLATTILDGIEDPSEVNGAGIVIQERTATQSVDYQDLQDNLMSIVSGQIINSDVVLYQMLSPYRRSNRISLV